MKKLLTSPDVVRTRICAIDDGGKGMAGATVCAIAVKTVAATDEDRPPTVAGVRSFLFAAGAEVAAGTAKLSYPIAKIESWTNKHAVALAKTDPRMIRFFCAWLRRFFEMDESGLRLRLTSMKGSIPTKRTHAAEPTGR
jgi:hypothetical protein